MNKEQVTSNNAKVSEAGWELLIADTRVETLRIEIRQ